MSGTTARQMIPCSIDEFLELTDPPGQKYELLDGEIIEMAPPMIDHGSVALRVGALVLWKAAPPWRAAIDANLRIDALASVLRPDISLTREPLAPGQRTHSHPEAVFEVLSPSNWAFDVRDKTAAYKTIESVKDIVLVSSMRRHVIHWRREGAGWADAVYEGTGQLTLCAIDLILTLDEIYQDTEL